MRLLKIICGVMLITCCASKAWSQPNILSYSSFLACDSIMSSRYTTCSDAYGNIYLAGTISSGSLPVTSNCHDASINGNDDCFLMKIGSNNEIVWCTYFGGSSTDRSVDISIYNDTLYFAAISNSNDVTTSNALFPNYDSAYNNTVSIPLISTWSLEGELIYASRLPVYINSSITSMYGKMKSRKGKYLITSPSSQTTTYSSNAPQPNQIGLSDGYFAVFDSFGNLLADSFIGSEIGDRIDDIDLIGDDLILLSALGGFYSQFYPVGFLPDAINTLLITRWNIQDNQMIWSFPVSSGQSSSLNFLFPSDISNSIFTFIENNSIGSYPIFGQGGIQDNNPNTGYLLELSGAGIPNWSSYIPIFSSQISHVAYQGNQIICFPKNQQSNSPTTTNNWNFTNGTNQGYILELDVNHNLVFGSYIGGNCENDEILVISANSKLQVLSRTASTNLPITNSNSCSEPAGTNLFSPFLFVFDHTSDVNDFSIEQRGLIVYPNPFSNSIAISFTESVPQSIELRNALGELVKMMDVQHSQTITFDELDLASGLYFLKANYQNGVSEVKKITKL